MGINRLEVMKSLSVHNLTKEVLTLSENRDPVDRYFDVKLSLKVLKVEMDNALKTGKGEKCQEKNWISI